MGSDDTDSGMLANHHTLGTRRFQSSPGNHKHDGKDSTLITIPVIPPIPPFTTSVLKLGLQATANINPVWDDVFDLVVPVAANTNYEFWGHFINDRSAGSGNMGLRFIGPTDAIMKWSVVSANYGGPIAIGNTGFIDNAALTVKTLASFRGTTKTATAGTLQMQFNQATGPTGGGSVRIYDDSILCIRKL